jgi:hypothetical protein
LPKPNGSTRRLPGRGKSGRGGTTRKPHASMRTCGTRLTRKSGDCRGGRTEARASGRDRVFAIRRRTR